MSVLQEKIGRRGLAFGGQGRIAVGADAGGQAV
jgi:hypothetical protein